MASDAPFGRSFSPDLSAATTSPTTYSGRRRSRTSGEAERIAPRHFGAVPTIETPEPFPSIEPELRSQPLSPQPTRDGGRGDALNTIHLTPSRPATSSTAHRRPIGIKRIPSYDRPVSTTPVSRSRANSAGQRNSNHGHELSSYRSHETGQPIRLTNTLTSHLSPVAEGQIASGDHDATIETEETVDGGLGRSGSRRLRRISDAARSTISRISGDRPHERQDEYEYNDDVIDFLDVVDPEVSTLTTLTNVQNSLFVPDLGRWLNRRPTYELSRVPTYTGLTPVTSSKPLPPIPTSPEAPLKGKAAVGAMSDIEEELSPVQRSQSRLSMAPSIASVLQDEHYAVLPHGVSLDGWTKEEKQLLDDHVRHMLHSRRSRFKRSMKAFGKYVRKPLGFFVTLYATLITLFGLAWVLFLIGWIYVGAKQLYVINIIDNVLVALFAIVGDGLAPFRVVDTYHMCYIAHYHHLSWRLRKERELPRLQDHNDLPEKPASPQDLERALNHEKAEFSVLSAEQQRKLKHHSDKFSKSHSFYKPHETATHHAFPLRLLVAIVVLLDFHSIFQISLGACTWGISYHTRPKALTPTILSFSITVNIVAGILIKVGDNKTRKKDVLMRMDRQQLTSEAMKKVAKQKQTAVEFDKKLDAQLDDEWEKKHSEIISRKSLQNSSSSSDVILEPR